MRGENKRKNFKKWIIWNFGGNIGEGGILCKVGFYVRWDFM